MRRTTPCKVVALARWARCLGPGPRASNFPRTRVVWCLVDTRSVLLGSFGFTRRFALDSFARHRAVSGLLHRTYTAVRRGGKEIREVNPKEQYPVACT